MKFWYCWIPSKKGYKTTMSINQRPFTPLNKGISPQNHYFLPMVTAPFFLQKGQVVLIN